MAGQLFSSALGGLYLIFLIRCPFPYAVQLMFPWPVFFYLSAVRRYGPLAPQLFFFLMGIIGKGKMCRK